MMTQGFLLVACFLVSLSLTTTLVSAAEHLVVDDDFLQACSKGKMDVIKKYIKEHPDWVNGRSDTGETCLHVAGIEGHADVTGFILEHGGDPNARSTYKAGLRMHPLSWNVYGQHTESIKLLLEGGADVNLDFDDSRGGHITVTDMTVEMLQHSKDDSPQKAHVKELLVLLLEFGGELYKDLPEGRAAKKKSKEEL